MGGRERGRNERRRIEVAVGESGGGGGGGGGWQVVQGVTLKYITPFFSTSLVISTNSCAGCNIRFHQIFCSSWANVLFQLGKYFVRVEQ